MIVAILVFLISFGPARSDLVNAKCADMLKDFNEGTDASRHGKQRNSDQSNAYGFVIGFAQASGMSRPFDFVLMTAFAQKICADEPSEKIGSVLKRAIDAVNAN